MPASEQDKAVIDEFRANGGIVGGFFTEIPLLLLHHRGARSGAARVNPLARQTLEHGYAIFASNGGADELPAWYYNLIANPRVTIEVGTETLQVTAREAQGEEYERIWNPQKEAVPMFAEYERMTSRRIPVIILEQI